MSGPRSYQFGDFRVDGSGRVLTSKGRTVPLPPKLGDTLLVLVENPGMVVEKQELLSKVWPGEFVEEGSLTRTISLLRNTLARCGSGEEYIITVPKVGYRFVPEVIAAEIPESGLHQKPILAVLPFVNLSSDPKQEFFSDGLTDEMIMQLGRTDPEKLGVIARTSAMKYSAMAWLRTFSACAVRAGPRALRSDNAAIWSAAAHPSLRSCSTARSAAVTSTAKFASRSRLSAAENDRSWSRSSHSWPAIRSLCSRSDGSTRLASTS